MNGRRWRARVGKGKEMHPAMIIFLLSVVAIPALYLLLWWLFIKPTFVLDCGIRVYVPRGCNVEKEHLDKAVNFYLNAISYLELHDERRHNKVLEHLKCVSCRFKAPRENKYPSIVDEQYHFRRRHLGLQPVNDEEINGKAIDGTYDRVTGNFYIDSATKTVCYFEVVWYGHVLKTGFLCEIKNIILWHLYGYNVARMENSNFHMRYNEAEEIVKREWPENGEDVFDKANHLG
jgi:hypothetical protein